MDMDMSQQTLTHLHTERKTMSAANKPKQPKKKRRRKKERKKKSELYPIINDCFCINAMNKNNRK